MFSDLCRCDRQSGYGRVAALLIVLSFTRLLPAQQSGNSADNDGRLSVEVDERRQQIEGLRTAEDIATAVGHLIAIDVDLGNAAFPERAGLQQAVLVVLAEHATPAALEHLRSVFETQTPRRHDAAYAISLATLKRPANDQDWRYLVRSLPIVEGEQAVSVLQALQRYRRRATKSTWVREIILIALRLPEAELPMALKLLKFWTGHSVDNSGTPEEQLKLYQDWFRKRYSESPDPELPIDSLDAKWTFSKLAEVITRLPTDEKALADGAAVYSKAGCHKCHRKEGIGDQPPDNRLGPDLTSLGWRRQPKEILSAILYPSHRLNDEYPVTTVVLQNGKTVSGLLMPDKDDRLKVIAADSKETLFSKGEIEEVIASNVSNMPAGLLNPLSRDEVTKLMAFLATQSGEYDPHRRNAGEQ